MTTALGRIWLDIKCFVRGCSNVPACQGFCIYCTRCGKTRHNG